MKKFDIRKFTDPDWLRTIAPARLVAFLDPWRAYLTSRGFQLPPLGSTAVDCEPLSVVLMDPDPTTPASMIDALYFVHETSSPEDMNQLIEKVEQLSLNIPDDPNANSADYAVEVWLANKDIIIEHHAEALARRQQNFDYYSGLLRRRRRFPDIDPKSKAKIESALDDWFAQHRRGRGSRLFLFRRAPTVWLVIRHGELMRREASHLDDGNAGTQFYRPQKHDVLVYNETHDEMAVSAGTKGEKQLYLRVLGLVLFGDEYYFLTLPKYTLAPLVDNGENSVLCNDIVGLDSVKLVEYRQYWGGNYKENEVRRADNIFMALKQRKAAQTMTGNPSAAVFKVKFSDSEKERRVIIRVPASACYERNEDCEVIEQWLRARGFMLTPDTPESDDDEDTAAVLEDAG